MFFVYCWLLINNIIFVVYIIKYNMPLLFIFFGLRFMFYSNDHEPIHVYVIKGKGKVKENAKFNIEPEITLIENNGLQPNELKMAEMVIEENKELIFERWNEFFNKNRKEEIE